MIEYIESKANRNGYRILLFNSKSSDDNEKDFLEICDSHRVAGIIMFTGGVSLEQFKNFGIPVITIERYLEAGTAAIECDNRLGGQLAAKHLIEKGCRKILHFGTNRNLNMPADDRYLGFCEYCRQHKSQSVLTAKRSNRVPMDFQKGVSALNAFSNMISMFSFLYLLG